MQCSIKVRGYHLDVYQHVNNARYLEFLEESRWQWLEETGLLDWMKMKQLALVAANININYRAPAFLGDQLNIHSQLVKIGHKSAVIYQEIFHDKQGHLIADASLTFVCFDMARNCSVAIDGELREQLDNAVAKLA
jgi:thioesterase III